MGIYAEDELGEALDSVVFPISTNRNYSKGRHGRVYGGWTTPLTFSQPSRAEHTRHALIESELRNLHEVTAERKQGERDSLLFS